MNKIALIVFIFIIFSKLCLPQSTKDSVLINHVLTPNGKIVPDTWKFDNEHSRARIIELDNMLQSVYQMLYFYLHLQRNSIATDMPGI